MASRRRYTPEEAAVNNVNVIVTHRVRLLTASHFIMDVLLAVCAGIANADFNTNDRFSDNPPPYSVPFKTFLIINTVIGFLFMLPMGIYMIASGKLLFSHYPLRFQWWLGITYFDDLICAVSLHHWSRAKALDGGVDLGPTSSFPGNYKAVWVLSLAAYLGIIIMSVVGLLPVYLKWYRLHKIQTITRQLFQIRSPCESTPMPTRIAPA